MTTAVLEQNDENEASRGTPEVHEKNRKYTLREQLQGFPITQILILMAARMAEPIGFTSLFPYVFFMVKHLRPEDSEASVARYAGYISGSFALSQALTGVIWGGLSDRYGRKPIMIAGLLGSSISMLWFGLAGSFWTALIARSLGGLLNGNVGVMRTVIGEVAVERRHQALAFSTMPLMWQVGCVLGPMLGGSLASPVENHPEWFKKGGSAELTFLKYPFLLPNIVVAAMLLTSTIIIILFMEETHETLRHARNKTDPGLKLGDGIIKAVSRGRLSRTREKDGADVTVDEETALLSETESTQYDSSDESISELSKPAKKKQIFTPQISKTMGAYALFSMTITVVDELLPVLLSTSVTPGNKFPFTVVGGLGLTSAEVGSLISATGVLGIFLMLFVFPWIDSQFGSLKPFRTVTLVSPLFFMGIPYLVFLATFENPNIKYCGALLVYFLKTGIGSTGFPSIQLLIQRSVVDRTTLGTVNGFSQMFAAGGRAIGPIVWGFLMAAGQDHQIAWLPWWALSLLAVVPAYLSLGLYDV